MSSNIKVIIEFNQRDHKGKEQTIRVIAEKEVAEEILEEIDDCESNLMEVVYAAMRSGMSTQMSYVSKKKSLQSKEGKL